ncbi:3-alpha-hydroxycholanate dehydrogenase (NADP(+)) [Zhongshania aliphaticivorans]|uniref:3-alpha-hydroxycholanate dehydrogenase (NADP(+)) n=1 Tax=Zhongshania aliphaticivorans TaxID=1470434 RepID=A0A5S9N9C8_9GAMM|nr:SDR family oxidoreductase [Zhongshania aliphaticivorans]CAA0079720.1 3-alpha-hydroxycholanate dehydrogenase (NADP(+)) [Zhongshania aliphaticivorans]CAA0086002.1 3-alpha-hydroxycholanate dehydrogenase (NADP(+)) [Zhongshania aliphaticivorans]
MQSQLDFKTKVVIITGGGKGVGRGISERFLQCGATVIICGRSEPESLPNANDNSAIFFPLDVRDAEAIQGFVDTIVNRYGRIDVLVNNAGGAPAADAATVSPRFSEAIIRLNLLAPLNFSQSCNKVMQTQSTGGAIINIASVSAVRPSPGTAAYGAAKAGLLNLSSSLAIEWAPKVRTNAIIAGIIRTEQAHLHYGDEAGIDAVANTIPLGRMAVPTDIGDACLFLASDLAAYISGSTLTVHGGGEKPAFLAAANAD